MAYVLLFTGIILEAVAAGLLKLTNGFKNKLATIFCLLFYGVSYYAVSLSMRVISLGVAYTTWCGCGILLTSLIGIFYYGQGMCDHHHGFFLFQQVCNRLFYRQLILNV